MRQHRIYRGNKSRFIILKALADCKADSGHVWVQQGGGHFDSWRSTQEAVH